MMVEKKPVIYIVDDNATVRNILKAHLDNIGYDSQIYENIDNALDGVKSNSPDLIFLNINIQEGAGSEFIRRMKAVESYSGIPIIIVSAPNEYNRVTGCIEEGASDYIVKPFNKKLLTMRIKTHLDEKFVREQREYYMQMMKNQNMIIDSLIRKNVKQFKTLNEATIITMAKIAEFKETDQISHLYRIREYCRCIASALHSERLFKDDVDSQFVEDIFLMSPLHDIGKAGLPDKILSKKEKYTEEEYELTMEHPKIGGNILRNIQSARPEHNVMKMGVDIAEFHHERYDGSGYPNKLSGKLIPVSARITAVCDVYDALTSDRSYKNMFRHEESVELISAEAGLSFDPIIVEVFEQVADQINVIGRKYR